MAPRTTTRQPALATADLRLQKLLDALGDRRVPIEEANNEGYRTAKQLAELKGLSRARAYTLMEELFKKGQVERVGISGRGNEWGYRWKQ